MPNTPPPHAPSSQKPLDRMDRLGDMLHFPPLVNAGATLNVLLTLTVTFLLQPRLAALPLPATAIPLLWIALILALNLLPVALLRLVGWQRTRPIPTLASMSFVHDQHRFSNWVYLAASANMLFWVLSSWPLFLARHTPSTLAVALLVAALATFSPVLLRQL